MSNIILLSYSGSGDRQNWEPMNATIPAEAAKEAHKKGLIMIAEYKNNELDAIFQFNTITMSYEKIEFDLIAKRASGRS
jgi:hypothetical protein